MQTNRRSFLAAASGLVAGLAEMDQAGVDMQVLSVTIPGVQMFESGQASELAAATNDYLAAVIARHPRRYAGLACFAPQQLT